jgi:RNA polymerase sigma-70 factor (ECF subfamily)
MCHCGSGADDALPPQPAIRYTGRTGILRQAHVTPDGFHGKDAPRVTRPDPDPLFLAWRQSGDPSLLGEVFDAVAPELQHLAERLCGRGADADDVLQATFLAAIESADRFDPTRRLLPWLVGIMMVHVRRLHERRQRRREQPGGPDEAPAATPSPAQSATQAELHSEVRIAITQLPPLQRLVVEACLVQQLPPHEVAARLGIPEGTCRMRLHRGLESLRALLPAGLAGSLLASVPGWPLLRLRDVVVARAAAARPGRGGWRALLRPPAVAMAAGALLLVGTTLLFAMLAPSRPRPDLAPTVGAQTTTEPLATAPQPEPEPTQVAGGDGARTELAPEGEGSLAVKFTFADGAPAAAIGVQLSLPDGARDFRAGMRSGLADANGDVLFTGLKPGFAYVITDRDVADRFEIAAGETTHARMVVARGVAVQGTVVSADGSPVANAEVRLLVRGDIAQVVARTAADGSFAADDVPTRQTGLIAEAAGHGPSTPVAMVAPMAAVRFELTAAATLRGTVCGPDGTPVRGASVGALRQLALPWAAMPESRTVTDDRGAFCFTNLGTTPVRLMIDAKGHAPWQQGFELGPGETNVPIRLARGQSLRGRLQALNGAAPGIAVVEVVTGAPELGHQRITGADSRFEVDAIHAGPITLFVQALGFQRLLVSLPERTDDAEVVISLTPAVVCNGTLLDRDRRPLAGWSIGFDPYGTSLEITAGDGRFACHSPSGNVDTCWVAAPTSPVAFPAVYHRCRIARPTANGSTIEVVIDPEALGEPDASFVPESRQAPFVPRRTLLAMAPDGSRGPFHYEVRRDAAIVVQGTTWLPTRLPFPQPADGEVTLRDADGRTFRASFVAADLRPEHPTVLRWRTD